MQGEPTEGRLNHYIYLNALVINYFAGLDYYYKKINLLINYAIALID